MNRSINENQPISLDELGWNSFFQKHYQIKKIPGSLPARVISESRGSFQIYCQHGELSAGLAGKMRYHDGGEKQYPAVGDWVVIKPLVDEKKAVIHAVLPRKSTFSRRACGDSTEEQIVATNIDTVFIVSGLDGGRSFNLRRIERYLTLAWSSGAIPAIVLNITDLCDDIDSRVLSVESIAPGISVHPVSAREKTGLDSLRYYLNRGATAAFLGSSGVGKSALINALIGNDAQATGEVREDDRMGRHTTTRRQLILLPGGGIVIDTPGMREIQLWAGDEDLHGTFYDIETLAEECRYADCSHTAESGCAVKAAIERGELDAARLHSYHKLKNELHYLAVREEHGSRQYEKLRWKKIAKWAKELKSRPY